MIVAKLVLFYESHSKIRSKNETPYRTKVVYVHELWVHNNDNITQRAYRYYLTTRPHIYMYV